MYIHTENVKNSEYFRSKRHKNISVPTYYILIKEHRNKRNAYGLSFVWLCDCDVYTQLYCTMLHELCVVVVVVVGTRRIKVNDNKITYNNVSMFCLDDSSYLFPFYMSLQPRRCCCCYHIVICVCVCCPRLLHFFTFKRLVRIFLAFSTKYFTSSSRRNIAHRFVTNCLPDMLFFVHVPAVYNLYLIHFL